MRPETEAELAAIIRGATAPLSLVGGGTRLRPGEGQGARLSTAGLRGITLYEPAAMTLVARAGTPLAEVQAALSGGQSPQDSLAALKALDSAGSAMVCVAILAQPKRGQALSKALYRFLGTLIGGAVSIVLVAAFGQDRVLMLVGLPPG